MKPLLLAVAVVSCASTVRAHGQFPLPAGTLVGADGGRPVVVTTFGLLLPVDDGGGFRWICEEIAGGIDTEVTWVRTPSGRVLGGSREGLMRFSESLCSVERPAGTTGSSRIMAMATHPSEPIVVAALSNGTVHLSTDDGATFASTSIAIQSGLVVSLLLDGPISAPRIAVLWRHLSDGTLELLVSDDGGQTSTSSVIADARGEWHLVAHDTTRPGQVYVREVGVTTDRLLRVALADGRVTTVLADANDDLAIGVSRDGHRVAMGGLTTALEVSTDDGETFTHRVAPSETRGLTWSGGGLYAAANNWQDGFAVGRSDDDGVTWQGLGRFADLRGVHSCGGAADGCQAGAAGCLVENVETLCEPYLPALQALLGIGPDAGSSSVDGGAAQPPREGCPNAPWAALSFVGMAIAVRRRR